MKAGQTLDGGLRIDAEDGDDWFVLVRIAADAEGDSLAERLGGLMDGELAEDWREFVVPDLRDEFEGRVAFVRHEVEAAMAAAQGAAGSLWISRERAFDWYGALNQARLALEERYGFGPALIPAGAMQSAERRSAYVRARFYCAIQSMLLEFVMK